MAYLKSPVQMPDVQSGLVHRLKGRESRKEDVLADKPRAVPTKVGIVGQGFDIDLSVSVDDVVT